MSCRKQAFQGQYHWIPDPSPLFQVGAQSSANVSSGRQLQANISGGHHFSAQPLISSAVLYCRNCIFIAGFVSTQRSTNISVNCHFSAQRLISFVSYPPPPRVVTGGNLDG
jgi:hypothetical protein